MMSENDKLLSLLQICDSGYPTGGFSHSSGLEAALKTRVVHDKESLKQFLYCVIENLGSFAVPFLREAHQSYNNVADLQNLDRLCEASTPNHVAKRASFRQGSSMLDTSIKVFKNQYLASIHDQLPHKHQHIVYGLICGVLGISEDVAVLSYLYNGLRAVVASAVRQDKIGPIETWLSYLYNGLRTVVESAVRQDKIGPIEGQAMQTEIQLHIPDIVERHKWRTTDDAGVLFPHADIVQNTHDTMFTKLFYS